MADSVTDKAAVSSTDAYNILGQPGFFTVNFTSPLNSLHQISGFKTEDDAQAWIAEARRLVGTYR